MSQGNSAGPLVSCKGRFKRVGEKFMESDFFGWALDFYAGLLENWFWVMSFFVRISWEMVKMDLGIKCIYTYIHAYIHIHMYIYIYTHIFASVFPWHFFRIWMPPRSHRHPRIEIPWLKFWFGLTIILIAKVQDFKLRGRTEWSDILHNFFLGTKT